jgi:phenylacetic acid degradation operon negative regulatory protein
MRGLRYAELRDGVWTRPDNLPRDASTAEAWAIADRQCSWWSGRPDDDPVGLAATLFATDHWAAQARALTGSLRTTTAELDRIGERALADAFVGGAAAVAHLRADPLLPAELCPSRWPGDALRTEYGAYEQSFSAVIQKWFRSH